MYKMISVFISFILLVIPSCKVLAVEQPHIKPEMVYRIRVVNDTQYMNSKFSGIKVEDITLPDYKDIKIANNPWSYILIYLGVENFYVYRGQLMSNMVEAGLSIRGTEVNNPEQRGWHPFYNYYPKKKFAPYNDPDAWRGEKLEVTDDISLALKVGEGEQIENSYRYQVSFYVNGRKVFVGPMYGNPDNSNQFDVKMSIGAYMASGDENEIVYPPFKTGDIQVITSTGSIKEWKTIALADFGIPKHRIGYSTEINNTQKRSFTVDFKKDDYSYAVGLEPAKIDKKSFLYFALFTGLGIFAVNN